MKNNELYLPRFLLLPITLANSIFVGTYLNCRKSAIAEFRHTSSELQAASTAEQHVYNQFTH